MTDHYRSLVPAGLTASPGSVNTLRMRWLPVVVVLALVCPVAAENIVKPPGDTDVVARVGDTSIYRHSVKEVVQAMLSLQEKEPDAATVAQYAKDALESLIGLELLYQESQRRGVTVSDADLDKEIERTKSHFPSLKAYQAALKERGLTEVELRRDARKTMAVNRLLEGGVWKGIHADEVQVREFYERHREEFQHEADIRASHILIRIPKGASEAQRQAAKSKAEALLAKLKAGADFAQLARESSDDPGTASRGGDLGYFGKGDMQEEFEVQAMSLKKGEISGLLLTPFGYHIVEVTDRRAAGIEPLDRVREHISAVIVKRERQKRQDELVAQLRKQTKLEYGAAL